MTRMDVSISLIFTLYTLISAFAASNSVCYLFDWGIKDIRILDILVIILFMPGALLDSVMILIITIIRKMLESNTMYKIKKSIKKRNI